MAPQVGFEPTTDRLTADCSTTELLRNSKELIPSTNSTFVIIICLALFVNTLFYFFAPNKNKSNDRSVIKIVCQRLFYLSIPISFKNIYPKTKSHGCSKLKYKIYSFANIPEHVCKKDQLVTTHPLENFHVISEYLSYTTPIIHLPSFYIPF